MKKEQELYEQKLERKRIEYDLTGKVFNDIYITADRNEMHFKSDNYHFKFYHEQDCCEEVYIESIEGDLDDIKNEKILKVDIATQEDNYDLRNLLYDDYSGNETKYTFYRFHTEKGSIIVRWVGKSHTMGAYSLEVDFAEIRKNDYGEEYGVDREGNVIFQE